MENLIKLVPVFCCRDMEGMSHIELELLNDIRFLYGFHNIISRLVFEELVVFLMFGGQPSDFFVLGRYSFRCQTPWFLKFLSQFMGISLYIFDVVLLHDTLAGKIDCCSLIIMDKFSHFHLQLVDMVKILAIFLERSLSLLPFFMIEG